MNTKNQKILVYGKKSGTKHNTVYVKEEDFQMAFDEESFTIPLAKLNEIQKKYINKKPLSELFEYEDFSIWWLMHPTIYPKIKKIINFILKFTEYIDEFKPTKIIINEDFSMLDIISQICKRKKIHIKFSKSQYLKFTKLNKIKNFAQKYRYTSVTNKKISTRKKLYKQKNKKISSIENKIIFVTPSRYRRFILNPTTYESEKGEYIVQNIMNLITDSENILGIDADYTFKGNLEILHERLESQIPWMPLEVFLTKEHKKNKEHNQFLKKYAEIISSENFKNLFEYEGISLWNQLEFEFLKLSFTPYLPSYLNIFDSLKFTFQKNKPKAIFLPYETGSLAQMFIIAAHKFGIKTIGIAHAITAKGNPMYSYEYFWNNSNKLGFPIPDTTLLFGNYSKQVLIKQGYPEDKFIIFGNAAFFNLDAILTHLSSKPLFEKYNLRKDQQIILFTTEHLQKYYTAQGKYDYDTRILENLLENFAGNKNITVVLKPHPHEITSEYEKTLDKFKAPNFHIIQGDLFELLHLSNLVISVFSTSMMDAITFRKPVIRVVFDNFQHSIPYDQFGVVIPTNLDNLVDSVEKLLNDKKLQEELEKNRIKFIKEQYNIPENNPQKTIEQLL